MQDRLDVHRRVSPEGVCIASICMIDLMTTLYWVAMGQAREGNPVMAYFLDLSHYSFIIAKISTFVPALVAAEWYRPRNPVLIQRVMRWVIIAYLSTYIIGVGAHYGRALDFYRNLLFG